MDFIEDYVFPCFIVLVLLLVLGLFGGLGAAGYDGLQALRARDAVFACQARNLSPVRKSFSTEVVCRARTLGADTLNVKVAQ